MSEAEDESGQPDPKWALLLTSPTKVELGAKPNVPQTTASSLYVSDVSNVRTADELVAMIRADFSVPGPMGDLDAVLSRLSDIDWAPNPAGYVWEIHGLPKLRANNRKLFQQLVGVWLHLLDRGYSTGVPFRIVVHGDEPTLNDVKSETALEFRALQESPYPWVQFEEPAVLECVDGDWRIADLPD